LKSITSFEKKIKAEMAKKLPKAESSFGKNGIKGS